MNDDEKKPTASEGMDTYAIVDALEKMNKKERRKWFCEIQMKAKGLTFRAMAKKHRVSAFLLSGAVAGQFRWTPRVIKCLESSFGIRLDAFFEDGETREKK